MSRVTLSHPDLPDQTIEVDQAAVPHYQSSGWQRVGPEAVPDPEPSTTPSRAPRRRQKKEGDR
ncbi:hypothetical protein [Streptomyces sp. NPDC058665]|uniref:hypothetical protein n=1 Tax=Streptomyces sp. NPDC058665 TaxID=3346586 RepID=UPI0036475B94